MTGIVAVAGEALVDLVPAPVGDYFEARYAQRGFVPWVDYRIGRSAFDVNYAYYRHEFRGNPTWERGFRDLYVARREGTIPRPPRTLAQQTQVELPLLAMARVLRSASDDCTLDVS